MTSLTPGFGPLAPPEQSAVKTQPAYRCTRALDKTQAKTLTIREALEVVAVPLVEVLQLSQAAKENDTPGVRRYQRCVA